MGGLYKHIHLAIYAGRIVATRLYIWARPILVAACVELLRRAHLFVGDLTARAQARSGEVVNEVWVQFENGDMPPLIFVARRVAMVVGKVALLRLLSHMLESARLAWTGDRD